jgi:hypothetical protein
MKKLLLLGLLFLVGCNDPKEKIAENNKELASGGTVVGVFPDGTKVRSYHITAPRRIPSGETWNNEILFVIDKKEDKDASILINGQLYAPAENLNDQ